jgi:hypothetical protein
MDGPDTVANQVIFPAYYCVKYRLGVESLKDTRGSWHIRISLNDDDDRSITFDPRC